MFTHLHTLNFLTWRSVLWIDLLNQAIYKVKDFLMFLQIIQCHCEDDNYNICRNVENFYVFTLTNSTSLWSGLTLIKTCWFSIQCISNCSLALQHSCYWCCWFGKDIIFSFVCFHLIIMHLNMGRPPRPRVPLTPLLLWMRVVQSARTWLLSGVYRSPWQHEATLIHFTRRNWNVNSCICIQRFIIFSQWLIIVLCHK